eukprot:5988297-Amphidinium_carterae.1
MAYTAKASRPMLQLRAAHGVCRGGRRLCRLASFHAFLSFRCIGCSATCWRCGGCHRLLPVSRHSRASNGSNGVQRLAPKRSHPWAIKS